jgi:hypothetical protein
MVEELARRLSGIAGVGGKDGAYDGSTNQAS